jgi:Spy/CpxP family protein refolding chaperone
MNKTIWKYVGIFALGITIGLALGAWGMRYQYAKHFKGVPKAERIVDRLVRDLDLTPDQRQRIGVLIEQNRERMDAIRTESRPRVEALRKEGEDAIRDVLTPEQAARFDALKARWEKQRPRRSKPDQPLPLPGR